MKYREIAKSIKRDILSDKYSSNDKIPSEREFAEVYNSSKITIRKALDLLVRNGYIYVKPNSGYYVNEKDVIKSLSIYSGVRMHELYDNSLLYNKIIEYSIIRAGEEFATIFDIKPNDEVILCSRIRYINSEVRSIEITYMPRYLVPEMTEEDTKHSIYDYVMKIGLNIYRHKKTFHGSLIPEQFVEELPEMDGVPVLLIENYGYLENGACFEKSYSYSINDDQTIYSDFSERL